MATWDEKAVFLEALARSDIDRAEFLAGACPDPASRERIERLLRHHTELSLRLTLGDDGVRSEGERLRAGDRLDEFLIVEPIDAGGMGEVYLAEDLVLGRLVAVKVLAPGLSQSERALARFRSEARAAAKLDHPGIVPIHALGECRGRHYIVSEYVRGESLAAAIERERETRTAPIDAGSEAAWIGRMVRIGIAIAEALDAAHRAGVVHCDVKPANILLDPLRGARLTDFGIARQLSERPSGDGELVGSLFYMSPEQAALASDAVDARSDIYSLGVVLYEAISLRRPIEGTSVRELLLAVQHRTPRPLRQIVPRISRDLETIVQTAMEKSPARRYQTAAHVAAELRSQQEGRPIIARPPSPARRAMRWFGTHRTATLGSLLALSLVAVGALGWWIARELDERRLWLTVHVEGADAEVWVERATSARLEAFAPAEMRGTTPLSLRLEPGAHRVTVVRADRRAWVEFDLPLGDAGAAGARELRVTDRWPAIEADAKERLLLGRFVPDVTDGMRSIASVELARADGEAIEPSERIRTAPFAIDLTEVSRGDIDAFRAATGWPFGGGWTLLTGADSRRPATILTDVDAAAFARYHGKRLPTAQEWEAAARGPEGLLQASELQASGPGSAEIPTPPVRWLDAWMSGSLARRLAAFLEATSAVDGKDPRPLAGGLLFMDGNVREMTSSRDEIGAVICKGRSFLDGPDGWNLRMEIEAPPAESDIHVGFRCATSLRPPGR